MGALKWLGSIAAAIVVLSVVTGITLAAGAIVAIVGALVLLIGMIMLIAGLLRSLWEEVFSR